MILPSLILPSLILPSLILPSLTVAFFDFGFSEMLMVGVVALLVFGGNLPDVMRTLGRNYAKLRHSLREFSAPVRDEMRRVTSMPPPDGIVRQMIDDAEPEEQGADGPNTDGFDDSPPAITSSPPDESEPHGATEPDNTPDKQDDLLDEGPLV